MMSGALGVVMVAMMIVMCGGMIAGAGLGLGRWARRNR